MGCSPPPGAKTRRTFRAENAFLHPLALATFPGMKVCSDRVPAKSAGGGELWRMRDGVSWPPAAESFPGRARTAVECPVAALVDLDMG